MPICQNCGTGLPVGHNFCHECGRSIGAEAAPAAAYSGPPAAGLEQPTGVASVPQLSGVVAGRPIAVAGPAAIVPEAWLKRTAAAVIDAGLVFMLVVVAVAVWLVATGRVDANGQTTGGSDFMNPGLMSMGEQMLLNLALVAVFYLVLVMEEGFFSTTIGKRVFGLRVAGFDGSRCTWKQALIRNLVKAPAISLGLLFTPVAFLLFLIPVLSDKERRRSIGDRMARTEVGKPFRALIAPPGWGPPPQGFGPPPPGFGPPPPGFWPPPAGFGPPPPGFGPPPPGYAPAPEPSSDVPEPPDDPPPASPPGGTS